MTLAEFVSTGWSDHAADAQGVFDRLPAGVDLVETANDLGPLSALIVHVAGEHLGRWADGLDLLGRLEELEVFDADTLPGKAVLRSKAILSWCAGDREAADRYDALSYAGGDVPPASNRVRILATAASALAGQQRVKDARGAFDEAVRLADYGPKAADPASKALAITGNNLAVELEHRATLSADEMSLMLKAAKVGLEQWSVAGGWMERERAHYRLAMSHRKAGHAEEALEHARMCLTIVKANGGDPGELFFAHEALALAHLVDDDRDAARAERDAAAAVLPTIADEDFRAFAAPELEKLSAKVDKS